jgi:anti-anti-sigma regulatory factor
MAVGVLCPGLKSMLRIRRSSNGEVHFSLSGRIGSENVAELESLILAEGNGRPIIIDLKDVTLAGEDGIIFLARCEAQNITLVNCLPYIREWITGQKNG